MARCFAFFTFFHLSSTFFRSEVPFKESTKSETEAPYLDSVFTKVDDDKLSAKLYDKRDEYGLHIVNFPFLSWNIPSSL